MVFPVARGGVPVPAPVLVLVLVHDDVEVYVMLIFAVDRGGGGGRVEAASFGGGGEGGGIEVIVSAANTVGGGEGGGGRVAVDDDGGGASVVALSIGAGKDGGEGESGEVVGPATSGPGAVGMGDREVGTWIWPSESCWAICAVAVGSRLVVRAKAKMVRGVGVRIANFLLLWKFELWEGVRTWIIGAGGRWR